MERALLHWIPGKATAPPEDLLGAPETLRSLLRYLEATGLRDPRGATTAENEAAIDAAAAQFSTAIADPDRYGLAKTMALAVGLDQPEAIEAFLRGGPGALPDVGPGVVQAAMARQARLPALNAERTMPQLPVSSPTAKNSPPLPGAAGWPASSARWPNGSARRAGHSRRRRTSGPRTPGSWSRCSARARRA